VLGTQNLIDAILRSGVRPWLMVAGSSAVYGSHPEVLSETDPLQPETFYALTKAAQEMVASRSSVRDQLPVAITRTFNLVGPGLQEALVLGNAARQIVRAERGGETAIRLGNLRARRDFVDVRDAVRAYLALARSGSTGVYNVCSGATYSVEECIERLTQLSEVPVEVVVEQERERKVDTARQQGSYDKIERATGWAPEISLDKSIEDLLDQCRGEPL
jgi:GDP-4-dehydro-6-deoxy-D-mannose reductase